MTSQYGFCSRLRLLESTESITTAVDNSLDSQTKNTADLIGEIKTNHTDQQQQQQPSLS